MVGDSIINEPEIALSSDASNLNSALRSAERGLLSLQNVAIGAMAAVGTATTAGLGASMGAAVDFDQSMMNSITVIWDVDDAQRKALEQGARDVATSTMASHEEIAELHSTPRRSCSSRLWVFFYRIIWRNAVD